MLRISQNADQEFVLEKVLQSLIGSELRCARCQDLGGLDQGVPAVLFAMLQVSARSSQRLLIFGARMRQL